MQSTQNKLIDILSRQKDEYISGQTISDKLNISRSAVWKHMKNLESAGYIIDAKSRVGYRIIHEPDELNEYSLKWGLTTKWLGKTIIHKESTISTQHDAHQLARDHAIHGAVIIADEQTNGVGRKNREWHSSKNKGAWLSIILRPNILPVEAPQLTLFTATVLADVIQEITKLDPQIKWPNDILINDKKVAGILTEMQAEQDYIQYVIIGIGININHDLKDLTTDIQDKATSLKIESKKGWSIKNIVQKILENFEEQYDTYLNNGFSNVKQKWERYGYKIGKPIWINTFNDRWQAKFLGIAEDGALLVESKNNGVQKVYSAEIDWYEED